MAISEIGMGTSNPLIKEYEVFLNFREPDIRREFTNALHHALIDAGIRVFIDDEELQPGKKSNGKLLQAIDDSKLYIPIFSTNYVSSHWCLHKLAKMVKNTSKSREDGNKKAILPIFYNMEPNDVMLKTELYGNATSKLEQSMEEVDKWRYALGKVDGTKRWEVEKHSSDEDLIESVVEEVVNRLQRRQREPIDDLVGMESQIVAVKKLLDFESGDVQLIGIYGMSGIGKTTLAKIIFDELRPLFGNYCSFLGDIREIAKTKGLVKLQERLLSDISNPGVASEIREIDHGIKMIRDTIRNKKVLIVLDDVNDHNQIQNLVGVNSLCPGSMILVTTRDPSVLNIRGFKGYEMEKLNSEDAFQLFSRHAFNNDSPSTEYYTLSQAMTSRTGGLPLALQTLGSLLFGLERKAIWQDTLKKLNISPFHDIYEMLMVTYNSLTSSQQQIFLDVACFFIGQNKNGPISFWKDSGFKAKYDIEVLIKRRMIKVLDDNSFWMHDQLRDFGKAVAQNWHTRLWERDDIICELRSTKIKESVRALCLQAKVGNPVTLTAEQIKRFPNLQFLWLSDVICQGDLAGCLSELKWISLHYSHGPKHYQGFEVTNLPVENVVVMELSGAEFTVDKFRSLIKGARKLDIFTVCCDAPVKIMSRI